MKKSVLIFADGRTHASDDGGGHWFVLTSHFNPKIPTRYFKLLGHARVDESKEADAQAIWIYGEVSVDVFKKERP